MTVHFHNHVPGQHAGFGSGAGFQHAGDDDALAGFDAKSFCQLGGQFIGLYANPASGVTLPSLTRPSITILAVETGMAKPMPMLPPERE